jgi:hypothetical protein
MKGIDRGVFLRWIPISYFGSLACSDIYHGHIWVLCPRVEFSRLTFEMDNISERFCLKMNEPVIE